MENITFVKLWNTIVRYITATVFFLVVGLISSFGMTPNHISVSGDTGTISNAHIALPSSWNGLEWLNPFFKISVDPDFDGDGVTCKQEEVDGTDPNDPCDFVLEHQDCSPSEEWKNSDCDGDGVTNQKEKEDGTDPLNPCDLILEHQNCSPSDEWKNMDCDGDGVTNEKEKEDHTDPFDPCDLILEHQNCSPSDKWKNMDCDGDGVTNEKEKEDGTDPFDPCDLILEHQNCSPSDEWKNMDCDGDGVTNEKEKEDGTDPFDPCDLILEHQNCSPSDEWKNMDCDGDGVTNEKEKEDGTDPFDPCDFVLEHQNCTPSEEWKNMDCDGDGVTNEDEKEDGTDPLDPCDYNPDHVTLPQSGDYLTADCDGDGVTNEDEEEDGTDPNDACDFVLDSQTVDPSSTWNTADCDGDGVTNGDEKEDGTDPLDPCDYNPDHVTLPQSGDYLTADCDGDGVTNEDEEEDGTDPNDACDFVLDSQTVDPSSTWNTADCDGDGVTNGDEKEDGTDPLDPCDYNPESVTLEPSAEWKELDCDGDGNPNDKDPNPLEATAVDDSGSTPALTEVAINILENDDYLPNNDDNNVGVTNLSRIGGTAAGVVSFDPDTGFMTYTPTELESNSTVTVVYQVCNVMPDPDVCASATVTIEVGANTIDAVDDSYIGSTSGGDIADSDVLSNDTLNGAPVTLSEVTLTSDPTDELTINPDGSVTVNPGTAEGIYTITYTICEIANVENCDTATVTVEVTDGMANVIDAVDDSYTGNGDIADSDVLSNDTLNGEPATLSNVILTSTPTDELTINPDGSVTVAAGTAEGTYTITYTICEIANVENCDTATVTVEVVEGMANVIDAVDDSYIGNGDIADSDVLSNDSLNGEPATLSNVILTSTPTDELTINPDGSVTVAAGTAEGIYTITYTICEIANVENCDTATVTVEVVEGMANVIDAVDDFYTEGTGGGTIPNANVLLNDRLDGGEVTLSNVILTSEPTNSLTINDDGTITVASGITEGEYTIEYTICEIDNPENCDTATVTVIIEAIEVNQMVTPNGDLKNDFLFIRGVSKIKSSTLQIFNRWGVAVYEGKNYDNVRNVFDGRSRGRSSLSVNDYLPAGVYFYIFNYETDKGSFTDTDYIYISR
jgi:gliding motility-associated-like protein